MLISIFYSYWLHFNCLLLGKIFVFYSIFYTVLAGMFTVCLQGLFSTLSMTEPKWTMEQSLIGTNPGMGFRPISNDTMHGSVIKFNSNNPKEKQYWINLIDDFLKRLYNLFNKNLIIQVYFNIIIEYIFGINIF